MLARSRISEAVINNEINHEEFMAIPSFEKNIENKKKALE